MGLQLFEWSDRFATGVELIDRQHRSLLQMTNELGDAITRGDAAAGERLLQGLRDYAQHHFRDEEAWALAAGVPAAVLDAHHGRHEAFVTELGQFSDLWAQDGHHARTLHRFLSAWLITHILGEDRRMVLGISGLPGSDVQAPAPLGDGEQVLLQAGNNLHDALASANADLERRVTERTAELAAANQRLRHNLIAAVKVFNGMIQLRGSRLAAHSRRVADMARHIAVTLKLPQADVDQVFVAGLLHDIGKVGLPDELLDMPMTHMNSQQLQLYQKHTVQGERAMMALDELHEAALMVRGHHERFDGKGFPDRLSGEHIPLGARILFAANDWDELLHGRKGGRALTEREAVAKLREGAGTLYDPTVVTALLAHLGREGDADAAQVKTLRSSELAAGMVLARDLIAHDGLLLLAAGQRMEAGMIRRIQDYVQSEAMDSLRVQVIVDA